jgi:hypothetical protein
MMGAGEPHLDRLRDRFLKFVQHCIKQEPTQIGRCRGLLNKYGVLRFSDLQEDQRPAFDEDLKKEGY